MTMKLSEAIREGCKYGPKILGSRHEGSASCALGAAENGQAGRVFNTVADAFKERNDVGRVWPYTLEVYVTIPKGPTKDKETSLMVAIADLNNNTKLSREAIAEWVETIERKLGLWDEPVKADSPVVVETVKASMEAVKI